MTTKVEARLNSYSPAVLSLFRVVFGFLFFLFGTSHVFDWPIAFGIPTASWPVWYAGIIELVTGLLIMLGLFTRIAAFIASGHMAVTYFSQHQPRGLCDRRAADGWERRPAGDPVLLRFLPAGFHGTRRLRAGHDAKPTSATASADLANE